MKGEPVVRQAHYKSNYDVISTNACAVPTNPYVIPTAGRNLKCRPLTTLEIFRFLPAVGMTLAVSLTSPSLSEKPSYPRICYNFPMFTLPTPLRYALFALFIGGILAYGAAFAGYLLVNFDLVNLIRDVNGDDSFYYFQIAYYLAEGKFSTFDGGITRTNGYHPLWLLLITPFYWIFDKEGALFAIKALEIMLIAGAVALIVVAARLARLPWYLLFALLPILYRQDALFQGFEAAAALFMLGLLFLALLLYARNPERWRWTWLLAAVAFALPWVRLEYIAISLTATAALLLMEWSRRERPAGVSWRIALISTLSRRTFAPIIGAIAGILTYFAYNKLVFGGIVPVSGATKRAWSQELFESEGGYRLFQNFQAIRQIDVFQNEVLLTALAICVGFLLALVWWLGRRSRGREDWLLLAFLVGVFSLAVGHIAKFAQTVLQVHPYNGSYGWYFVPAYLLLALAIPVGCYVAIHFLRRFIGPRSALAVNGVSVVIVVVGAVWLFTGADFAGPFRYVDGNSRSTYREWEVTSYMGMSVVNAALPADSVIGSWDAGAIGYFSRFPVVNLDGLVNSYDYFHATKSRVERYGRLFWKESEKEEFRPLYREFGITHFANLTEVDSVGGLLYEGPQSSGERRFNLWPLEPPEGVDTAAWFWQRMEPHLAYQADGVGLLVDGRLAQVFARDCRPEELVVWEWSGAGPATDAQAWTQTQTGLCTAAAVLPPEATPPVGIKTATPRDYLASLVGDREPAIRSDFDVYPVENRLLYVREQCRPADLAAWFFLALYPVEVNDLPGPRRQHGFDNLDFLFNRRGVRSGDFCLAVVPLPEYEIATIYTGQVVLGEGGYEHLWEGEILLRESR